MNVNEKLSEALKEVGLYSMAIAAKDGYYSDFKSPLATPKMDLIEELAKVNTPRALDLRRRVMDGEFDDD